MKHKQQVSVAAESFAAGVFAHAGYSVFVQYGANQPGYDLVVSNDTKAIHVSVKGNSIGGWMLTSKNAAGTYASALQEWTAANRTFVFCFVSFTNLEVGQMPRMYIADGNEVGEFLKTHGFGEIALSLVEHKAPTRGPNKGKTMQVNPDWLMTQKRIDEVFKSKAT